MIGTQQVLVNALLPKKRASPQLKIWLFLLLTMYITNCGMFRTMCGGVIDIIAADNLKQSCYEATKADFIRISSDL